MMRRRHLIGTTVFVVATACACGRTDAPSTPPQAPDPPGRVLPNVPGTDDPARGSFAEPLSLQDAAYVLRRTSLFEFGGMPPKRQVQAFNVLFDQPDAPARFRSIGEGESAAGRLYALAGLLLLDRTAATLLRASLSRDAREILVFESDVVYEKPVGELATMIEQRALGTSFRRVRDETNDYFAGRSR